MRIGMKKLILRAVLALCLVSALNTTTAANSLDREQPPRVNSNDKEHVPWR